MLFKNGRLTFTMCSSFMLTNNVKTVFQKTEAISCFGFLPKCTFAVKVKLKQYLSDINGVFLS